MAQPLIAVLSGKGTPGLTGRQRQRLGDHLHRLLASWQPEQLLASWLSARPHARPVLRSTHRTDLAAFREDPASC
jgi:hypothetical protein